ncbi:MAG: hypothetical protein H6765_02395 [Candidatus Peribacteria bacterium]|nr:MAG: hypothetical protein H6765_02395 [Candidatus Peribacteria bacterium]
MLQSADDLLLRYGGHEQAGGLTVSLDHMSALIKRLQSYCEDTINPDHLVKTYSIDTRLYEHELNTHTIKELFQFGPFGE